MASDWSPDALLASDWLTLTLFWPLSVCNVYSRRADVLSALPGGPAVHWPLGCLQSCDPETASGRENIQHQLTGHQLTDNDKQWGTHNTDNNARLRKAGMIWSGNGVFFEKA